MAHRFGICTKCETPVLLNRIDPYKLNCPTCGRTYVSPPSCWPENQRIEVEEEPGRELSVEEEVGWKGWRGY